MLLMAVLCACNPSDTITQIIYEQNPENEVDETQYVLVNSPTAEITSDALPQISIDDEEDEKNETEEELPSYGDGDSWESVPEPVESQTPDTTQTPAQSRNATNQMQGAPARTQSSGSASKNEDGGNSSARKSSEANNDGGTGGEQSEEGENPDNQGQENQQESGSGKNADNDVKVYEDYGEFAEIPTGVKKVTAVGQAAVIVSMLGGSAEETPLVGADAQFVNNANVQRVLASKGIANVQAVWANDGTSEGDLADVQAVIDLDPDLCFVTEGDKTFTDEQKQALLDERIIVYVLPNMTSASKILYAVQLVGEILEEGGNAQAGALAKSYRQFHNDVVKDLVERNGGITGGFNYDTGKSASTNASLLTTLYISDWDYSAVYDDRNGFLSSSRGVAVADVGYEEHPLSYYMSVGGAVNNAAEGNYRTLSGYTAPVWQFSLTQAPCSWGHWTSIDRSKVSYPIKGDGFDWALLWSVAGAGGLGTQQFPGVVVRTQAMKQAMEADAAFSNGLYYPYPRTESSHGGVIHNYIVGFYSGTNLVSSCIGVSGAGSTASVLNDGTTVNMYDIYVNPTGLLGDWADGAVESILESAWIYSTFRDSSYDCTAVIRDFYETFYGYSLTDSDIATILAGAEA